MPQNESQKQSFFLKKTIIEPSPVDSCEIMLLEQIQNNENLQVNQNITSPQPEEDIVLFHHQNIISLSCPTDFNEHTKLTHIGDKETVERELKNEEIKQKETLTKQKLEKCKKEKEQIGYKRRPGQLELFGLSADKAALVCNIKDGQPREWTHLIAHEFLGNKKAQTKDNLVLATYACNTAMMHLEFVIKKLLLAKHNVNVEVTAQADNSSPERSKYHCVSAISYVITVDGKRIPFSFDPNLSLNPPKNLWRGMLAKVVSELICPPSMLNGKESKEDSLLNLNACKLDLTELAAFLSEPSDLGKRKHGENELLKNKKPAFDEDIVPAFEIASF
ncbi:MAG: hypothetical protein HKM04_08495 [Legionellales bacterium]|nr:hypothetical protein [Legionellales bacterium]